MSYDIFEVCVELRNACMQHGQTLRFNLNVCIRVSHSFPPSFVILAFHSWFCMFAYTIMHHCYNIYYCGSFIPWLHRNHGRYFHWWCDLLFLHKLCKISWRCCKTLSHSSTSQQTIERCLFLHRNIQWRIQTSITCPAYPCGGINVLRCIQQ